MLRRHSYFVLTLLLVCLSGTVHTQIISSVAGNGLQGYSGDGGPAISARMWSPTGVTFDDQGNYYFGDALNNVVRKVNISGIITTIAGTGAEGYSGDGGPARTALFGNPCYPAFDKHGNLYLSDQVNNVVRKIDVNGIVSTFAGTGAFGNSGDGGPAIAASFGNIYGIVADAADNIYLADYGNSVIRKVNPAGIISTFAGTGTRGFSGDGGLAINAQFSGCVSMCFDAAGNMYVADGQNIRVRKIDAAGIISTVVGNGTFGYSGDGGSALLAGFKGIFDVKVDRAGNLYISDANNYVVRKVDCSGIVSTFAGNGIAGTSGDGGPATAAKLGYPFTLAVNAYGSVLIADDHNFLIRKVANPITIRPTATPLKVVACSGGRAAFANNLPNNNSSQWQVNAGQGWTLLHDDGKYAGTATSSLLISGIDPSMDHYLYRCIATANCAYFESVPDTLIISNGTPLDIQIFTATDSICQGTQVTFTATVGLGVTNIDYQWNVNNANTGPNAAQYSTNGIVDGDQVSCTITDKTGCLIPVTVQSNTVHMHVNSFPAPTLQIAAPANKICAGDTIICTAASTDGGVNPRYEWQVNGVGLGAHNSQFHYGDFKNGDVVTCVLEPSGVCSAPIASANSISITVDANPIVDAGIDTILLPGKSILLTPAIIGYPVSFAWSPTSTLDNSGIESPLATPAATTSYKLMVTDQNGCIGSDIVTIGVFYKLVLPNAFSPNGDGINEMFRIPSKIPIQVNQFSIFNRWGNKVFNTTQTGVGWDGSYHGQPQPVGTYVWVISFHNPLTGKTENDRGTFLLLR